MIKYFVQVDEEFLPPNITFPSDDNKIKEISIPYLKLYMERGQATFTTNQGEINLPSKVVSLMIESTVLSRGKSI